MSRHTNVLECGEAASEDAQEHGGGAYQIKVGSSTTVYYEIMVLLAASDLISVTPPNLPPEWTSTPTPSFIPSVGGTYSLSQDCIDPEADPITYTLNGGSAALPTGVTISGTDLVGDGTVSEGTTAGILIDADDGVNSVVTSPSFSIVVTDAIAWPAQDAWAGQLPAVRNRNGAGVVCPGRGFGMNTPHANASWNVTAQTGTPPTILHVDSLANSGNTDATHGSLPWCVEENSGPRIIVFDVAGEITITSALMPTDAEMWIAGQSAPGLVWLTCSTGKFFKLAASDIFVQHIAVWNEGTLSAVNNCMFVSDDAGGEANPANIVFDHCFIGGATDQCFDAVTGNNITAVDCLIALPRASVTRGHAYGGLWGAMANTAANLTNVSHIGNTYAFCQRRTPSLRILNGCIANQLVYGSEGASMEFAGKTGGLDLDINIEGYRSIQGLNGTAGDGEIYFIGEALSGAPFGGGSTFYLNDNLGARYSTDEWDIVTDDDNVEAGSRVGSRIVAAWPTGLVVAPNRSMSEADFITLMTQNTGPRPNARLTFIQDIIDDIVNGTGDISNDYATPAIPTPSSAFSPVATPHQEGVETGRTKVEEQLLDLAEGFLI